MPNQATASDLPFYDIFVPQKFPLSKISDDVTACDFWFAPTPIKNAGYAYARGEGAFEALSPQITACVLQARVNFCTVLAQEDQQSFAQKQVTTNAFFSMKQQDKSRERDEVA